MSLPENRLRRRRGGGNRCLFLLIAFSHRSPAPAIILGDSLKGIRRLLSFPLSNVHRFSTYWLQSKVMGFWVSHTMLILISIGIDMLILISIDMDIDIDIEMGVSSASSKTVVVSITETGISRLDPVGLPILWSSRGNFRALWFSGRSGCDARRYLCLMRSIVAVSIDSVRSVLRSASFLRRWCRVVLAWAPFVEARSATTKRERNNLFMAEVCNLAGCTRELKCRL